jgi:hypothetical protein
MLVIVEFEVFFDKLIDSGINDVFFWFCVILQRA